LVKLKDDIRVFIKDVNGFYESYLEEGPMVTGINP
jgi:hypothetical protein